MVQSNDYCKTQCKHYKTCLPNDIVKDSLECTRILSKAAVLGVILEAQAGKVYSIPNEEPSVENKVVRVGDEVNVTFTPDKTIDEQYKEAMKTKKEELTYYYVLVYNKKDGTTRHRVEANSEEEAISKTIIEHNVDTSTHKVAIDDTSRFDIKVLEAKKTQKEEHDALCARIANDSKEGNTCKYLSCSKHFGKYECYCRGLMKGSTLSGEKLHPKEVLTMCYCGSTCQGFKEREDEPDEFIESLITKPKNTYLNFLQTRVHEDQDKSYGEELETETLADQARRDADNLDQEDIFKLYSEYDEYGDDYYNDELWKMYKEYPVEHKMNQMLCALKKSGNCFAQGIEFITLYDLKRRKEDLEDFIKDTVKWSIH